MSTFGMRGWEREHSDPLKPLKFLSVVVAVLMIGWAACGITRCCIADASVKSGTIVGHQFTPAHIMWIWISHGKNGGGHLQPIPVPDHWGMCLEGKDYRGRDRQVWITVDQTTFHETKDGAHYERE